MAVRSLGIVLLVFFSAAARAQGGCSAPALGHPCATEGVATQGPAEPEPSLGIGNPVHLASGNKHQHEIDLPANPQAPLLQVVRHYNSLDPRHGGFGRGWSTSYDTRLYQAGGRFQIVQADGSRIDFGRGGSWPLRNRHGMLQPDGPQWIWTWPDGRSLRFDARGRLIRIAMAPLRLADAEKERDRKQSAEPAKEHARTRPVNAAPEGAPPHLTEAVKKTAPAQPAETRSGRTRSLPDAAAAIDIVRHAQAGPLYGKIARVVARQGGETRATLEFHYRVGAGRAHVSAIDTPLGRFDYVYDQYDERRDRRGHRAPLDPHDPYEPHEPRDGSHGHYGHLGHHGSIETGARAGTGDARLRLAAVRRPDGYERRYLYEADRQSGAPHLVTGIALAPPGGPALRTHSWAYDAGARATASALHHPPQEGYALRISYPRPASGQDDGLTLVESADGRQTRFEFGLRAGRYRLLGVDGAPCPGCAAPGSRAVYDGQGRLQQLNGSRMLRSASGELRHLFPEAPGWPGLILDFDEKGRREAWHAAVSGSEKMVFDDRGRPIQRLFANGDEWRYFYDEHGRPARITARNDEASLITRLSWNGRRLAAIRHPNENETRRYDGFGRLVERRVQRPFAGMPAGAEGWAAAGAATGAGIMVDAEAGTEAGAGVGVETGAGAAGAGVRAGVGTEAEAEAKSRIEEYIDRFEYDAHHRLAVHHLPEGGALLYDWNAQGRLMRIEWLDARGRRHEVIRAWTDRAGYRYGNGLALALHAERSNARARARPTGRANAYTRALHAEQGNVRALALHGEDGVVWEHFRHTDALGRPVRETDRFAAAGHAHHWRHAYDAQSRLIMSIASDTPAVPAATSAAPAESTAPQHTTTAEIWHAWRPDGSAAALRHGGRTARPDLERDASGLPLKLDGFELSYGPQRRLEQVRRGGKLLDRYRHNAFGHRIQASTPNEHAQFFYLNDRLVAESRQPRAPGSRPDGRPVTRRYVHAGHALVAMIDYSSAAPSGVLYAVHADLLGAPRMVTDADRKLRWLARYTPWGAAQRISGDLVVNLRLPGQIMDATTGWHDNLQRSYHPGLGHYLEPDPLGPLPGTQALGYAAQQPRRYADPLGLLLFAFDGTRQNAHNRGNVWLFGQHYQDGPVFYHSGPGNPYYLDLDTLAAHTAPQIMETQWQHLLNALHAAPMSANEAVPIDIIGYSRGAALARHFGNLIGRYVDHGLFSYADPLRGQVTACVDLRFMGLFDTVAQFGLGGALNTEYDFSIAAAWSWVAHAVALHERRWLFPLLAATRETADNVVEAPFVGAHADIGGGVPHNEPAHLHGDLSDVALNWMLWQARAASVPLSRLAAEQATVSNPILHDARSSLARSVQEGDRRVDGPDGRKLLDYQDEHHRLGRSQRLATEALINRYEDWRRNDSDQVGTVDLDAYARWLYEELGWHAAPA